MPSLPAEALLIAGQSIFVFIVLLAALALVALSLRKPKTPPLAVAAGLVVGALVVVVISPWNVPLLAGIGLAAIGIAVAVVGGDPVTRRVLEIATHGTMREGLRGGILIVDDDAPMTAAPRATREVMRGGATIGYLERLGVVLALVAGFPEAIAVVVAVKGVGRFSELAESQARERFIIGTLASLLWAGVVGALVRLAIW